MNVRSTTPQPARHQNNFDRYANDVEYAANNKSRRSGCVAVYLDGVGKGDTPGMEAKSKGRVKIKVFRDLLELVDDGEFFEDEKDRNIPTAEIVQKYSPDLQALTRNGRNLLHIVMKEPIDEEQDTEKRKVLDRRLAFVRWLLSQYPGLFTDPEALSFVIEEYTDPQNCRINREFAKYFLSERSLQSACRSILNESAEVDLEVEVGPELEPSEKERSKKQKSPYRAHRAIKEMGAEMLDYLHLIEDDTLKVRDTDGNTPLHVALEVGNWREDEIAQDRVKLIKEMIRRCTDALTILNKEEGLSEAIRKSPYQYHQEQCKSHHSKDGPCKNESCRKVEDVLKEAYMRLPINNQLVIKHLYNGKQVLYSHLDLSELKNGRQPPPDLLKNMERCIGHMKLETILRYVSLPRDPLLSAQSVENPQEYTTYTGIFDWLRRKKVRTIIRLRVEDNENLPHSHERIVSALKDINVDVLGTWPMIGEVLYLLNVVIL